MAVVTSQGKFSKMNSFFTKNTQNLTTLTKQCSRVSPRFLRLKNSNREWGVYRGKRL
jgi:hypothetical protein